MNIKQATVQFFRQHNGSPIVRRACHKRRVAVRATEFVEITDLIPQSWIGWFFVKLSESGDITWGDANRTFVTAERLADIVQGIEFEGFETTEGAKREWIKKVRRLGQMYVDLEN